MSGRPPKPDRPTGPSGSKPDQRGVAAMADDDVLTFCAVGDVTAFHKEPESGYEFVAPVLAKMDVVVAQNERHYSKRRDIFPIGGFTELTDPSHAKALLLGHYDVLTFASNHCMDLG